MTTATTLLDTVNTTELFRKVETCPIQMVDGAIIPNKKAIIYSDTGEYVSTVGDKYRVVNNEEVFTPFAKAIVESQLDLNGIKTKTTFGAGGRSALSFIFPEHSVETRKGDATALQLVARNSHDGSWKFQVDLGGFRIICANGQVAGNFATSYANRHSSGFNIDEMASHLTQSIESFNKMGQYWLDLQGISMDRNDSIDMVLAYLGRRLKTSTIAGKNEERDMLLNSGRAKTLQAIVGSLDKYRDELGGNAYATYNALTDHASHASSSADSIFAKGKQVTKVMESLELAIA